MLSPLHTRPPGLDSKCSDLLTRYDAASSTTEKQKIGYELETLAGLLFAGIAGAKCPESFGSAGSQIDLLVCNEPGNQTWRVIQSGVGFPLSRPDILVEAKATQGRVTAAQLLRLCGLIESHFRRVGLGVFIALEGASGHPKRGGRGVKGVRDARLHQLLFYIDKGIPIVVLDRHDLQSVCKDGDLLGTIAQRVLDLNALHGQPPKVDAPTRMAALPPHLQEVATWHGRPPATPQSPK